jgi:hypothetical protein
VAKPDIDDGWLKYAHELDAALAVADFTKGARIVLREVFSQIYGPAKKRTAKVSPSAIGAACGMDRHNISRGLKELVDGNVLRKQDDGVYTFNKDYETWLESGRGARPNHPRFTPEEMAWCRNAPALAMSYKHQKGIPMDTRDGIPMDTRDGIPMDTTEPVDGIQIDTAGYPNGYQKVSIGIPENASPRTPIEERTRDLRLETIETTPTAGEGVSEIEAFARAALGTERYDGEFFGQSLAGWLRMGYRPDWVRDAVQLATVNARAGKTAQYVNGCLIKWRRAGVSPAERDQLEQLKSRGRDSPRLIPVPESRPLTDEERRHAKAQMANLRRKENP